MAWLGRILALAFRPAAKRVPRTFGGISISEIWTARTNRGKRHIAYLSLLTSRMRPADSGSLDQSSHV